MRAIACVVAVLLLSILSGNVLAASSLNAGTLQKLVQLESKYFRRSFGTDSDENRVERLEKYVFGEVSTGSVQQRVENLAAATISVSSIKQEDNPSPAVPVAGEPAPTCQSKAKSKPAISNPVAPTSTNSLTDSYPHIAALENAILGQSFAAESLADRLNRMEKKAFGSASANADAGERTDALDSYVENHLHKKLFQGYADSEAEETPAGQPVQDQPDYPRITALEKAILTQTYPSDSLVDRLSRMEVKAFGSASTNQDLSDRTDALEKYAGKKLGKKPADKEKNQDTTANAQNGGGQKQILSMLGKSLLGMAGLGGVGPGGIGSGGVGSGSMGMGGMGMGGMGMGGMGMGGMGMGGMGMGGMGMGGMGRGGMHRRSAQQQPEPQPEARQDDPAIFEPTPPDSNTRLITKVGWCEMQVFGKTFPTMHLPDRLGQLSQEIHFETDKSRIELMDDIGPLMKAVLAHKQTVQSIGSKSEPAVR